MITDNDSNCRDDEIVEIHNESESPELQSDQTSQETISETPSSQVPTPGPLRCLEGDEDAMCAVRLIIGTLKYSKTIGDSKWASQELTRFTSHLMEKLIAREQEKA